MLFVCVQAAVSVVIHYKLVGKYIDMGKCTRRMRSALFMYIATDCEL